MSELTVYCPACGFSRQFPFDKVPEGTRRVTCPRCRETFNFTRPEAKPDTQGEDQSPAAQEIPAAFAVVSNTATEPAKGSTPPPSRPASPAELEMTDIGDLFRESWDLFRSRFATLIGLCLLGIAAFIAPALLSAGVAWLAALGGISSTIIIAVGVLAGIVCGAWCFGGFLCAVTDEGLNLKEALERGKAVILPLVWVSFLTGFIVCGGYFLLIVPGIIFSIWFFFAQFVLVKEDVRGMEALLKSREYVRGQWLAVAIRLLLIWGLSFIVGAIPLAGPFLSIAFIPYVVIYHYLIYRDLRQLKGDVPYSCGTGDKLLWPGVALIGLVLVPVVLVSIAGLSMFGALSHVAPFNKGVNIRHEQSLKEIRIPGNLQDTTEPATPD